MWRLTPKHTPESVAAELVRGLEDGSIVLRASDVTPKDPVVQAVTDAVSAAVAEAVTANRRDAKGPTEILAAVTAAAERAAARVLGATPG